MGCLRPCTLGCTPCQRPRRACANHGDPTRRRARQSSRPLKGLKGREALRYSLCQHTWSHAWSHRIAYLLSILSPPVSGREASPSKRELHQNGSSLAMEASVASSADPFDQPDLDPVRISFLRRLHPPRSLVDVPMCSRVWVSAACLLLGAGMEACQDAPTAHLVATSLLRAAENAERTGLPRFRVPSPRPLQGPCLQSQRVGTTGRYAAGGSASGHPVHRGKPIMQRSRACVLHSPGNITHTDRRLVRVGSSTGPRCPPMRW